MKTQSNKEINKKARVISLGLLAALLFFLLILFVLWRITDEFVLEKENAFDFRVFDMLSHYISPFTTKVMLVFTFFGSRKFLLPAYILLTAFFLFYKRKWLHSISIVAVGLGTLALVDPLKSLFHRHRPLTPLVPDVLGYSYPSGHSFSSFTFFGLLTYIIWKTNLSKFWKWLLSVFFISFAVMIALSRVYLHVHFASDVIAGFCLSMLWLGIAFWILQRVQKYYNIKTL